MAIELCNDYSKVGDTILNLRQHSHERIRWLDSALTASRRLNDRSSEAAHLGSLGSAYEKLGEPHLAIKYYEKSLALNPDNTNGKDMLDKIRTAAK